MEDLNTQLDTIEAEVMNGNLDLLLENYTTYTEETKDVLAKIEGYKTEVDSAIAALDPVADANRINELKEAQASVTNIIKHFNDMGVK